MGNAWSSIKKANFEDIQVICKRLLSASILINTLDPNEQKCLILGTLPAQDEEHIINQCITNKQFHTYIIIYGRNCYDEKIVTKYKQLLQFGFKNIHVYFGGIFEWLLLQDIYGSDEFPTTSKEVDILKYKCSPALLTNKTFT